MLTGLREGSRYNIYVTSLDAVLKEPISLPSNLFSVRTASSEYILKPYV